MEKETEKERKREFISLNQEKDGHENRERKEKWTVFWMKRKIREKRKRERGKWIEIEFPDHEQILNLDPKHSTVGRNLWERDWSGLITGRTCHGRYK